MLISPSKIFMYNECPKKLDFRYVMWIPQQDQPYFKIWRNVEERLRYELKWVLPEWKTKDDYTQEEIRMADTIYLNKKFRELIQNEDELKYQTEYKNDVIQWYSDIETSDSIIDIKTSSTKWNSDTVSKYKYQAWIYLKYSWKKNFYFVVLNKNTYEVQVIRVWIKDFTEIDNKIFELQLAFQMWAFPKKEWYHCKRCDYKILCNQ